MMTRLSKFLDTASDFFAHRKGLLPIIGLLLVLANAVLQFFPAVGWIGETDILLHLGIIIVILGFMLAWAL